MDGVCTQCDSQNFPNSSNSVEEPIAVVTEARYDILLGIQTFINLICEFKFDEDEQECAYVDTHRGNMFSCNT
jgi:hypothetical protein